MKKDGHPDTMQPEKEAEQSPSTRARPKTLGTLGRQLTAEERLAFEQDRERDAAAQRAAMHNWTEEEVLRYVGALKSQAPDQYADYLRQETEQGVIEEGLWLEMRRFASSMFPQVSLIDVTNLLGRVRADTRRSLH